MQRQPGEALHEGFLRYAGFRWLKLATVLCATALLGYMLIDIKPHPNGGSWYGYTLGTIGALLILWLTMLGVRKRAMTRGRWSLKAWTSAHVYLGLSLIIIATLHTGFEFGWNVHTLAYVLMVLVIVSGMWGVWAYAMLPQALSDNRQSMTETQMLDAIRAVDRQLHDAAQPLDMRQSRLVAASLDQDPFAGGLLTRLRGRDRRCVTERAFRAFRRDAAQQPEGVDPAVRRVEELLDRKKASLSQLRRHLRLKAMLEIWLYIHIPVTFVLIAALAAHIISVFFYW